MLTTNPAVAAAGDVEGDDEPVKPAKKRAKKAIKEGGKSIKDLLDAKRASDAAFAEKKAAKKSATKKTKKATAEDFLPPAFLMCSNQQDTPNDVSIQRPPSATRPQSDLNKTDLEVIAICNARPEEATPALIESSGASSQADTPCDATPDTAYTARLESSITLTQFEEKEAADERATLYQLPVDERAWLVTVDSNCSYSWPSF
jgi:hypothetical protein